MHAQNEYAALFVALIGEGPNPQVSASLYLLLPVVLSPCACMRADRTPTSVIFPCCLPTLIAPVVQGIVNTSEGKVVRAFHRFTLVDQTGKRRAEAHSCTPHVFPQMLFDVRMLIMPRPVPRPAGQGRDLTKGRTRDAGAVKISCARQVRAHSRGVCGPISASSSCLTLPAGSASAHSSSLSSS